MVSSRSPKAAAATPRDGARSHSPVAMAAAANEKTHQGKAVFR
jgi:hypothetical protein